MEVSMGQLFGTDGIRGIANVDLRADLAFRVGQAAAFVLAKEKETKPVIAIGKDTRISSDMLEAALIAGICSSGADAIPLGVIPTPAVAFITAKSEADAGIVISASHNPYEYNGIKIFNSQGYKLSEDLENEIESLVLSGRELSLKTNGDMGRVLPGGEDYVNLYINRITAAAENISGLKVVFDCANGSSSRTAGSIFGKLPIDIVIINDRPDGININNCCGSTNIEQLGRTVVELGYDIGIAFDGDADRCIAVDENGNEVDGDKIMAVCGEAMKKAGRLKNETIVATVMSNIGFRLFAEEHGINLLYSTVGDKNVLELMLSTGANLGGEQSGHLIFLDDSTTGDGQLAAVKFLNVVSKAGKPVSELTGRIKQFPQLILSVPIDGGNEIKDTIMADTALLSHIAQAERELGETGRVLVRPSGTEALIRVMVEARDTVQAETIARRLTEIIRTRMRIC
jgi:phosphoglucosamine mutase